MTDGPDLETMMLARDLCAEQEAIKYPDPNDEPLANDAGGGSHDAANDLPDYAVHGRADPDNDRRKFPSRWGLWAEAGFSRRWFSPQTLTLSETHVF